MNRHERRAISSGLRRGAFERPDRLEMVAPERWPPLREPGTDARRIAVWWSKKYLVQVFQEPRVSIGAEHFEVHRLSVNRTTLESSGRWEQDIAWLELQAIKGQVGFADAYALEVFPPAIDVVDVANMRHLWVLDRELPIGWKRY